MGNVKEINRIEALRLSCSRGELMPAWCCPKAFCPDEGALSIPDIGVKTALLCTSQTNNGKKDSFSQKTFCMSEKIHFLSVL